MDLMEEGDFDELAMRLSKYISVKHEDTKDTIERKLFDALKSDSRGNNLTKVSVWRKLWRNIGGRMSSYDGVISLQRSYARKYEAWAGYGDKKKRSLQYARPVKLRETKTDFESSRNIK
jgi:hypothetical protein